MKMKNLSDHIENKEHPLPLLPADTQDGFKVPEGYFEALEQKLLLIPASSGHNKLKVRTMIRYSAIAASILIVAASTALFVIFSRPGNESQQTGNITAEQWQQTLSDYLYENLDEETLYDQAARQDIAFFNPDNPDFQFPGDTTRKAAASKPAFVFDSTITRQEILEYLSNENAEPEIL